MRFTEIKLEEGMVLINHTCDAIDPITCHEYNPHDEKLVVYKIDKSKNRIRLYNLTTSHLESWRHLRTLISLIQWGGYTLTDERA